MMRHPLTAADNALIAATQAGDSVAFEAALTPGKTTAAGLDCAFGAAYVHGQWTLGDRLLARGVRVTDTDVAWANGPGEAQAAALPYLLARMAPVPSLWLNAVMLAASWGEPAVLAQILAAAPVRVNTTFALYQAADHGRPSAIFDLLAPQADLDVVLTRLKDTRKTFNPVTQRYGRNLDALETVLTWAPRPVRVAWLAKHRRVGQQMPALLAAERAHHLSDVPAVTIGRRRVRS